MAPSSPSEFLTFFRRASASQALRQRTVQKCAPRPFTSSIRQLAAREGKKDDIGGPDTKSRHTLEKGYDANVQTDASKQARQSRAQDAGGAATEQKDPNDAAKKAKTEFPEAPDSIGFQDERGGKGH